MKKLKTHKAIRKRVKLTGTNKIKIRAGGQDHFNSRESGKTTKNKRRDINLSKVNVRNIRRLIPHS